MILFQKIIYLKLKVFFLLLLFLGSPLKTRGQQFEWVYTTESDIEENILTEIIPNFIVRGLTTNSNNEIYIIGTHHGYHRFEVNANELTFGTANSVTDAMIIKLDENKNVLWAKLIKGGFYEFSAIIVDINGNLLISGGVRPYVSSLYLDPNPPNPLIPNIIVPTHENLSNNTTYGFVLKWDSQGNYIDSILFEDISILDTAIDTSNDIIIAGYTSTSPLRYGYVGKLDSNLNLIWDNTYNSQGNSNVFFNIVSDSQNNIYCQGTYRNSFTFGNAILQSPSSEFICKMLQNGNEEWIIQTGNHIVTPTSSDNAITFSKKIKIDTSDNLYFYTTYFENYSYQFNNTTISNLPLISGTETVLFKADSDGNHVYNVPLYGTENQNIIDFDINNLGELITVVGSNSFNLHYGASTVIEANGEDSFLLKSTQAGELIDFKRLDIKGIIRIDSENNILLGGFIIKPSDFDPHPFDEYIIYPNLFENGSAGNSYYESVGFVLKLSNCDVEPLFLENYAFCSVNNPNPTIGDIEPNSLNISWYSSVSSQTPLDDDFLITDGATYYMEKIAENCPILVRQPVLMTILPPPDPPVIDSAQPCYYENMRLSDLNIQGENLTFYDSLTGEHVVSDLIPTDPNNTYYVTQTINGCESERIPINIGILNLMIHSLTVYVCDNGKDDTEVVNLTDYVSHFTISLNGFSVSYHTSSEDAFNGTNVIQNYQNYQAENNQTFYLRFYSEEFGCFEVVELTIGLSLPPEIIEIQINDFAENNSITVLPYNENYLYSLNGITYQNSNYFDNLQGGEHFVYVKDKDESCQPVMDSIFLLSYPKFFTPNGDGINDYWRIQFSQYQVLLNVEIYDRYGKLITFFDKDSAGWDGTYNGKNLSASDYWFKITRISDQKIIYRGHFALAR